MQESSEVPPKVRLFQHSSFMAATLFLCLVIYASLFSSLYLCLMFLREFHRKLVYAVIQKPYTLSILKFY